MSCLKKACEDSKNKELIDLYQTYEKKIYDEKRVLSFDLDYYCLYTHILEKENKLPIFYKL